MTTAVATTPITEARPIVYRTRGSQHGPIIRLMSPGDLGEFLKPFVFLDLFGFDTTGSRKGFGMHPHSGIAKLSGVPQMVQVFEAIGFGQWFRYVTGVVEVGGAVLLLVPTTGFLGGLLLTVTMGFAVATHVVLIGGSPAPAIVLALLSAFVTWRLRPVTRLAARAA